MMMMMTNYDDDDGDDDDHTITLINMPLSLHSFLSLYIYSSLITTIIITTTITASSSWFRDFYKSKRHITLPRQRALAFVLSNFFPRWHVVKRVHESSPNHLGLSQCLRKILGG